MRSCAASFSVQKNAELPLHDSSIVTATAPLSELIYFPAAPVLFFSLSCLSTVLFQKSKWHATKCPGLASFSLGDSVRHFSVA